MKWVFSFASIGRIVWIARSRKIKWGIDLRHKTYGYCALFYSAGFGLLHGVDIEYSIQGGKVILHGMTSAAPFTDSPLSKYIDSNIIEEGQYDKSFVIFAMDS